MTKTAVVFDADRVLVDSGEEMRKGSNNVFMRGGGTRPPTSDQFFCEVFFPVEEYYWSRGVQGTPEMFRAWYFEAADHERAPMFPDVVPVVTQLASRSDLVLGVVSAHDGSKLQARFQAAGISHCFASCNGHKHDKVASIRDFGREHGTHRTLYVGDLISDMRDAHLAGAIAVGITRGSKTRHALIKARAHHCIDHLDELPGLLS